MSSGERERAREARVPRVAREARESERSERERERARESEREREKRERAREEREAREAREARVRGATGGAAAVIGPVLFGVVGIWSAKPSVAGTLCSEGGLVFWKGVPERCAASMTGSLRLQQPHATTATTTDGRSRQPHYEVTHAGRASLAWVGHGRLTTLRFSPTVQDSIWLPVPF